MKNGQQKLLQRYYLLSYQSDSAWKDIPIVQLLLVPIRLNLPPDTLIPGQMGYKPSGENYQLVRLN